MYADIFSCLRFFNYFCWQFNKVLAPEDFRSSLLKRPELPPAIAGFIDGAGPSLAPAVVRWVVLIDEYFSQPAKTHFHFDGSGTHVQYLIAPSFEREAHWPHHHGSQVDGVHSKDDRWQWLSSIFDGLKWMAGESFSALRYAGWSAGEEH